MGLTAYSASEHSPESWMNPFPKWANPDRTELETDNPVKRVSYVLGQIQLAGKVAYENRFDDTQTADGTTQIVAQPRQFLPDNFSQSPRASNSTQTLPNSVATTEYGARN